MSRRWLRVSKPLAVIAAGLFLAACSSSSGEHQGLSDTAGCAQYCGFGLKPAQPRPSFTMTDTTGAPFAFGTRTAGHPTLLFFGYTKCPDVCPQTMADVGLALHKLPADLQKKTYVVFVSTDVKNDTPAVLTQWMAGFHSDEAFKNAADYVGLRGTEDEVHAAEVAAHVTVSEDGGQTHSAELLLYGPDDYARVAFNASSNEQDSIAHDLPLIASS